MQARAAVLALGVTPVPARAGRARRARGDPRIRIVLERSGYEDLAGKRVAVIGAGNNGVESALLALRAQAASVELIVRSRVRWFAEREPHTPRGALRQRLYGIAYPVVGFGPPPINRFALHPDAFARLPHALRTRLNARLLRPGAAPWLRRHVDGVIPISEGVEVQQRRVAPRRARARPQRRHEPRGRRLHRRLRLRVQPRRPLGARARAARARRGADGWPVLDRAFRTSVPQLSLVGFPAEGRFGPLSRFVEGAEFAAQRVAQSLAGLARRLQQRGEEGVVALDHVLARERLRAPARARRAPSRVSSAGVGCPGGEHARRRRRRRAAARARRSRPGTTRSAMPPTLRREHRRGPTPSPRGSSTGRPSQSLISANASQSASCSATSSRLPSSVTRSPRPSASRRALDRRAVGAVAEDAQLPALAARPGERLEQRDQVLGRREARSAAEHEAVAGRAARRQHCRCVDAVVDHVQLAARRMRRACASCRSWLETHTIASLSGRDGALGVRIDGPAAPPRPENAQPCAVNTVRTPVRASGEAREHAGLRGVDLRDVGLQRAGQRAQLAHGGGVVVGMRIAHEVANVVERHAERGAGVGQRPAGPVRCDLDVVAVAEPGHERGGEGLRSARLGERHDARAGAGVTPRGCSTRRVRRPGGGASVAPASRARNSHSGSERSTIVRRSSLWAKGGWLAPNSQVTAARKPHSRTSSTSRGE